MVERRLAGRDGWTGRETEIQGERGRERRRESSRGEMEIQGERGVERERPSRGEMEI